VPAQKPSWENLKKMRNCGGGAPALWSASRRSEGMMADEFPKNQNALSHPVTFLLLLLFSFTGHILKFSTHRTSAAFRPDIRNPESRLLPEFLQIETMKRHVQMYFLSLK
jgi:hypothetical protein